MRRQLLKPALERILCKVKSDLLNPEVYWGGPLWKERITGAASKCQRKMGPVGWEGRASSCGAEVSGCSGTGLDQGWVREQSLEPSSRRECRGWWEPQRGLEAHTQLRGWSWGSVPGLGMVPWRQLPEGAPPSCHGVCKVPSSPGDPQILEVNTTSEEVPLIFQAPWWRIAPMKFRSEC